MRRGYATLGACAAMVIAFACLAWSRRWIADDGLIVVRTARELLAGNGPTYNAFERTEPNTSTLWMYVVALVASITRADITFVAIVTGAALTVAGLVLALDGARRLDRTLGGTEIMLPFGVLVMIGAYPFWDYATAGLENGLVICWLAGTWWLLVALVRTPERRLRTTAFVFGLGPLVRPELAVATVVWLVAGWLIVRPPRGRAIKLGAIAVALPIAYEVFRAGYYGTLVPLPAIAKSATSSHWLRGLAYLLDFQRPYLLWIPVAAIAVVLAAMFMHGRTRVAVAAPVVIGVVLALYVVRVGGDFMHARMLLAPLFAIALPVAMIPVRRATIPAIAIIVVWAVVVGSWRDDHKSHATTDGIEDEHSGYVVWTAHEHPTQPRYFVHSDRPASFVAADELLVGRRKLIDEDNRMNIAMNPELPGPIVYACGRLGTGGFIAPIDGIVGDQMGLANPIGARITPTCPTCMAGHEKPLPTEWLLAEFAAPDVTIPGVRPEVVTAARHVLGCGAIAELLASTRDPLTPRRFWDNLTGAIARTRLVIPADPHAAEQTFCGNNAPRN
jgi:arabinofuranosyltransferase